MQCPGRKALSFFIILCTTVVLSSCGTDVSVERIGTLSIPEQGLLIQWYAIGADMEDEEAREAAIAELEGLPQDWRIELIFFRDHSMARSFAQNETHKEEIAFGFYDPSVALATLGGGLLIRDAGSDMSWSWFDPPVAER